MPLKDCNPHGAYIDNELQNPNPQAVTLPPNTT
jgi:hypothetical protein